MNIIKDYEKILNILKHHISDTTKNVIKKSEVTRSSPLKSTISNVSYNNSDVKEMTFQIVNKVFMIHDLSTIQKDKPKKILFKRIQSPNSYKLLNTSMNVHSMNNIQNVIFNLTDTKYAIIVSDQSFQELNNSVTNNCSTPGSWSQEQSTEKTLIMHVKYADNIQKNALMDNVDGLDFSDFENMLLKLISELISDGQAVDSSVLYTFSILNVNGILLAILLPRTYSTSQQVINVWPFIPVSQLFRVDDFINNLKVGSIPKSIFIKLSQLQITDGYSLSHSLREQFKQGITFLHIINNKVTLLQIYIAYFEEFLSDGKEYSFVSVIPDCASYIRCSHCQVIYDSIFGFIRHWWSVKGKLMFRCHICNAKVKNLTILGTHYSEKHSNEISPEFIETTIMKITDNKANGYKTQKRMLDDFFDDYVPKKRIDLSTQHQSDAFLRLTMKRKNKSMYYYENIKRRRELEENGPSNYEFCQ